MNNHQTNGAQRGLQTVPRDPERAEQPATAVAPPNEANLFLTSPEGVSVHFKLYGSTPVSVMNNVDVLIKAQLEKNWTPGDPPGKRSPGNGGGAAAPASAPAGGGKPSKYRGPVYAECPRCEGNVYDNRKKKDETPSWKGPWFKCRDEDCGWATFKADGSEGR